MSIFFPSQGLWYFLFCISFHRIHNWNNLPSKLQKIPKDLLANLIYGCLEQGWELDTVTQKSEVCHTNREKEVWLNCLLQPGQKKKRGNSRRHGFLLFSVTDTSGSAPKLQAELHTNYNGSTDLITLKKVKIINTQIFTSIFLVYSWEACAPDYLVVASQLLKLCFPY